MDAECGFCQCWVCSTGPELRLVDVTLRRVFERRSQRYTATKKINPVMAPSISPSRVPI